MRKVIFAVHTEYHLMFALKMICVVPEFKDCKIIIQRLSPLGSQRLQGNYIFDGTGIIYKEYIYNFGFFKGKGFKNNLKSLILDENPEYFILFYELHPWYTYLLPQLKKAGTIVILAPDGINLYNSKINFSRRWGYFIYGNVFLFSNGFLNFMKFPSRCWGYRKEIDSIAIENKDALGFKTNKTIIEVKPNNMKETHKATELINYCFNVNLDKNIVPPYSFLWVDEPVSEEEEKREIEILCELKKKYPERTFYIKPHPRSNIESINTLKEKLDGIVLNISFPAEILFDNMENVFILSICSTAMLHWSQSCKYYWIYPMFRDNAGFNPLKIPVNHIHVVNDINEID